MPTQHAIPLTQVSARGRTTPQATGETAAYAAGDGDELQRCTAWWQYACIALQAPNLPIPLGMYGLD